jgi:hypothetical protein
MASYILSTQAGYVRSVLYAGIFTLVHLLDVFVLIVASKYVFEFFDPTRYLALISQIAAVILIGVAFVVGVFALR